MASVIDIEGIGETEAAKLKAAGIDTVEELLKEGGSPAGRRKIAENTKVDGGKILEWVNRADLMRIDGVARSSRISWRRRASTPSASWRRVCQPTSTRS